MPSISNGISKREVKQGQSGGLRTRYRGKEVEEEEYAKKSTEIRRRRGCHGGRQKKEGTKEKPCLPSDQRWRAARRRFGKSFREERKKQTIYGSPSKGTKRNKERSSLSEGGGKPLLEVDP